MRPSKITPAVRARCEEIAGLKRQIPSYKQLEIETGINRNYLAKVIHTIVQECSTLPSGPLEPEKNP